MLSAATRVLRLTFTPRKALVEFAPSQLIEFVAYGHECQMSGLLRLDAERLTDLLNASDEVDLVEALALGLNGGTAEADHVIVERSALLAVKAGEPRGSAKRRIRTRQIAVVAGAGPYLMHGFLHGRPGADLMIDLGRRPPMIPLTDATIAYDTAQGWRRDRAATLIINRDAADWVRPAKEDELTRFDRRGAA